MRHCTTLLAAGAVLLSTGATRAQPGMVLSHQKINDTQDRFTGTLDVTITSASRRPSRAISTATAHWLKEAERIPVGFATFYFDSGTE